MEHDKVNKQEKTKIIAVVGTESSVMCCSLLGARTSDVASLRPRRNEDRQHMNGLYSSLRGEQSDRLYILSSNHLTANTLYQDPKWQV
jgi:hypothetical protein